MSDWRNLNSALLCALADVTQKKVAQRLDIHESAVSEMKAPRHGSKWSQVEQMARLLAALDMRIVPAGAAVLGEGEVACERKYFAALVTLARQALPEDAA